MQDACRRNTESSDGRRPRRSTAAGPRLPVEAAPPPRRRGRAAALARLGSGFLAVAAAGTAGAQPPPNEAAAELFLGTAWSLPLPLVIRLPGQRLAPRARYATRPFADAPYYAYRVGGGRRGHAVEAELVHHKLYLTDPQPPVERFEVTHGYNLMLGNVAIPTAGWRVRLGVGLVVAHPEGRIAGRTPGQRGGRARTWLGGGYHLAGVTTQLALGRRYPLGAGSTALTVAPEAKLTAALARVPLEEGSLLVPNVAVHALAGLGVRRRW